MKGERRSFQEYSIRYVNKDNLYMCIIDQAVIRSLHIGQVLFFRFYGDEDKNPKREPGQYSAILTKQACSIRDLLYGIARLRDALWFLLLGLPVFVANCILETRQDFWFLCFHCR